MTGFYIKCNTGLKWVNTENNFTIFQLFPLCHETINKQQRYNFI